MSRTIIDEFVMLLGFDTTGLSKGRKAAKKELGEVKAGAKDTGKAFKELKSMIGEFLVVLGSAYAVKKFVVDITNADAIVSRFARNMRMDPNTVNAWGNMLKGVGGGAADAKAAIESLSMTMTEMHLTGESGMIQYLRALNAIPGGKQIALRTADGGFMDKTELFLRISDKLSRMKNSEEAVNIAKMMGFSDPAIQMMMRGRAAVERELVAQKKRSELTKAEGEAAEKAEKAWANFGTAMSGVQRVITQQMLPVITYLTEKTTEFTEWLAKHEDVTTGFFVALAVVMSAILIPTISGLVAAFAAFWVAALPATMVMAALGLLAKLIYNVYQNWKEWKDGSRADAGFDAILSGVNALKDAWSGISDAIGRAVEAREEWYSKTKEKAKTYWEGAKAGAKIIWGTGVNALSNLIGQGEGDYNSVNTGKRGGYSAMVLNLQAMTIKEILRMQAQKEFGAVGKYQMIHGTLKGAVRSMGLSGNELFTDKMQDEIFRKYLIGSKRPEISEYLSGKSNNLQAALLAMAKEWASVADPRTGKSFYAGIGNNKASISAAQAAKVLQSARSQMIQNTNNRTEKNSHVETNIGTIEVHTPATDGKGVAEAMKCALSNHSLINQADCGLA